MIQNIQCSLVTAIQGHRRNLWEFVNPLSNYMPVSAILITPLPSPSCQGPWVALDSLFICRLVNCLPITLGGVDAAACLLLEVL